MGEAGFFTGQPLAFAQTPESPSAAEVHRKTGTFTWEWSVSQIPAEVAKRLSTVEESRRAQCQELLDRISEVLPLDEQSFEALTTCQVTHGLEPVTSGAVTAPNLFRRDFYHSDLNDSNILFKTCDLEKDNYECSA